MAWGPAVAAAVVPGPIPDSVEAWEAVPAPGPAGAREAVPALPVESPTAAAAAVEGVAVLAVTHGGCDGRRIWRS